MDKATQTRKAALMLGAAGMILGGLHKVREVRTIKPYNPNRLPKGFFPFTERDRLLNKMTNWQRNKCLQFYKGKGALKAAPLEKLAEFCKLPHWKKARN